jgi:uncharacterized protein YprB with RNaseH-like and TPR domain
MTQRDDETLREVLEALTRLRLSHDRLRAGRDPGDVAERRPLGTGAAAADAAAAAAPGIDFGDLPWLDEAGAEPTLEALVGAEVGHGADAQGVPGEYLRREVDVETRLPHLAGLGEALREALPEAAGLAGLVQDADLLAEARAEDLLFLDLETTGLHRGIIVLLGFMRLGPGEKPLTCTQLFPRGYAEEAPMLGEFLVHLRRHPVLVTFNGRSFDAPFLESRLRFHGWFEPLGYAHVDLLHLARRLWRGRLPDYRLQTLERRLCGRRRLADLPGSEVPRVWEDFERSGELRHLPGIWEHNLRDIATLAEIMVRAAREQPLAAEGGLDDAMPPDTAAL